MIAGKMNCKLKLLQPHRTVDRMGAENVEYKFVRTVWAERVTMQGVMSEEVGEHFPAYSIKFNIRSVHPVEENWRIEQLGGYLYNVCTIIPNRHRGYVTLVCERVNE